MTGSNPASRTSPAAVSRASGSSLASGMPRRSSFRCASFSSVLKYTVLNAFTHRLRGNLAAAQPAEPCGWADASRAAAPSRCSYALAVSSTIFPASNGARSGARSGIAFRGTVSMMTSPKVAASTGAPADAGRPSRSINGFSVSGCLDARRTSWPASTHNFASVDPIIPAPTIPMRIMVYRALREVSDALASYRKKRKGAHNLLQVGILRRMTTLSHRCNVVGRTIAAALLASVMAPLAGASTQNDPDKQEWIQLFNGRNLDGWTAKFAKHDLGENFNDTVRVENGLLEVRYDKWRTFNGEFGHVFYNDSFSYYRLVAEYRFVGEQVAGGPTWAIRNNGLMLHCQKPGTMLKDQDFPISIEVQLLGGLGDGRPRSTANVCTPGSNVVMNGQLHTQHCTNSTSTTYDGDQ